MLDDDIDSNFYVTAWQITHFLMMNSFSNADFSTALNNYLTRYHQGEESLEAFSNSFGFSPEDLQKQLGNYFTGSGLPVLEWSRPELDFETETRVLSEAESLIFRAGVSGRSMNKATINYLEQALKVKDITADEATNAWLSLAIEHIHHQDMNKASEAFSHVDLNGLPDHLLGKATHFQYDQFAEFIRLGDDESAAASLALTVETGRKAVEKLPTNLEAHIYLARAYDYENSLQEAVDTLLAYYDHTPNDTSVNFLLASVLIKARQLELADYLLARLYSASHSTEYRSEVQRIRDAIAAGETDLEALNN